MNTHTMLLETSLHTDTEVALYLLSAEKISTFPQSVAPAVKAESPTDRMLSLIEHNVLLVDTMWSAFRASL